MQTPRQSIDISSQGLNLRNLLCLRALLNLGIALGQSLSHEAWLIVFQALQQVEALMSVGPTARIIQSARESAGTVSSNGTGNDGLAAEIAAVDTARRRMLDATSGFHRDAFTTICKAVLHMTKDLEKWRERRSESSSPCAVSEIWLCPFGSDGVTCDDLKAIMERGKGQRRIWWLWARKKKRKATAL